MRLETKKDGCRVIYSDEGKCITNGFAYTESVFLAYDADANDWYEISCDDVPLNPYETAQSEEATIEDYREALKRLGVVL